MGVLTGCKPRKDVLKGDLDDAIFAAEFGDLISGKAPAVYGDSKTFFQNTYPTEHLKKIVQVVFERLANPKEGGAAIRLSTGFGGGKTHTLMALWHLAQNIDNPAMGTDLLPAAGRPKKVTVAAVDAGKAGSPVFLRHGKLETHSLWGELAYDLDSEKAYKAVSKLDNSESNPDEDLLESIFPSGPVLILLDELVVHMATLSDRGQGNLLSFLKKLGNISAKRPQTVLVVTDPGQQIVYAQHAAKIGEALAIAASHLDEMFGRKMADFDAIGKEAARVIVRRLFEKVEPAAAQRASALYHSLYTRVLQDSPGAVPNEASGSTYSSRIVESYPFHPRLLDTAQDRLGALQDFQKSRGVLRLFARILRDTWEANEDVELITAGEINWSSPRIQADLLQRLNRDNFKAAVSADIEKHAAELDGGSRGIHCRVASALLLESLPLHSNSGLDPAELTLAVLKPDEAGPEPAEALDRLVAITWHTYPMPGSRGWQFRYEPNIIRQIDERKGDVPIEDAKSRVLADAQHYFGGPSFRLTNWPTSARQVPETTELQLVLCEDEKTAKLVCNSSDDSDPKNPLPRRFRNAIVAVTANETALREAIERAQRLLAAELIERDHRTGEAAKLTRDQLGRVKPELHKFFRVQTYRAFDRVVLAGVPTYTLEEKHQVSEEQMLQRPQGQACLRKFLESKELIYSPGDTLDVDRFMKDVLPGTTPLPDQPEVYTGEAVHQRFLSAPSLRLIPDGSVTRQTLLKAVENGKIVVRLHDGRSYDSQGCVSGPEGMRRRDQTALNAVPLDKDALVTAAGTSAAKLWTAVDKPGEPGEKKWTPPPPTQPDRATAYSWEEAIRFAADRPLITFKLTAGTPADASRLSGLAQPMGASSLQLSVSVSGDLKDGGSMNFAASQVKPNHPAKPLQTAQTIFNSLVEGSSYEAELSLDFGDGRNDMRTAIEQMAQSAPDSMSISATFGKLRGAKG